MRDGNGRNLRHGRGRNCGASVRAFTLLELMIVISLLVLLAMLAWPAMSNRMKAAELPESASHLRSTLYMARSGAILENRRVRVRFEEGEQQPIIEIERDPFDAPGNFERVKDSWNQEPALLSDVQVHSVSLGRPEFMKPVAPETNPNAGPDDATTDSPDDTSEDGAKTQETLALRTAVENKEDPNRPTIMFEPDGSTDWVWLVVARQPPGGELSKDADQRWIIIDGRTGLITVREALSEEELADPDLCVARAKLELPDIGQDITKTGFQVPLNPMPTQQGAGSGLAGGLASGQGGSNGQAMQNGDLQQGLEQALGQKQNGGDATQSNSLLPHAGTQRQSGVKKNNGLMTDPTQLHPANQSEDHAQDFQASTLEELQQKLDQSNLSPEEKQRLLDAFEPGQKGR